MIPIKLSAQTLEQMKQNCTAADTVKEMHDALLLMARAVGVEVQCSIISHNPDAEMNKDMLASGYSHMLHALAVMSHGARFNPRHVIKGIPNHEPLDAIRHFEAQAAQAKQTGTSSAGGTQDQA